MGFVVCERNLQNRTWTRTLDQNQFLNTHSSFPTFWILNNSSLDSHRRKRWNYSHRVIFANWGTKSLPKSALNQHGVSGIKSLMQIHGHGVLLKWDPFVTVCWSKAEWFPFQIRFCIAKNGSDLKKISTLRHSNYTLFRHPGNSLMLIESSSNDVVFFFHRFPIFIIAHVARPSCSWRCSGTLWGRIQRESNLSTSKGVFHTRPGLRECACRQGWMRQNPAMCHCA